MNGDEGRKRIIKQTRRAILDVLNLSRPVQLTYETISGALPTTDEHYVRRDLDYLIKAGYVIWVNPRVNAPWDGRLFELSKEGVDIADRMNTDPALEP